MFKTFLGRPDCSGVKVVKEGDTVRLSCEVKYRGGAMPKISWTEGLEDQTTDHSTIGLIKKNLTMEAVASMDQQTYTCSMNSEDIQEQCSVTLDVQRK